MSEKTENPTSIQESSEQLGTSEQAKKDAEENAESYERKEMEMADQEAVDEEAWALLEKLEKAQKEQEEALEQLKAKMGKEKMGGKPNRNKKNKKQQRKTRKQRRR